MLTEQQAQASTLTRIALLCGLIAGAALLMVALAITVDIFLRWSISAPIKGLYELTELAFMPIIALGMVFTNAHRGHVTMGIMTHLTGRELGLNLITSTVTALTFTLLTWFMFHHAGLKAGYGETTLVLLVPLAPFWYLGTAMMALATLAQFGAAWLDLRAYLQGARGYLAELAGPALALLAAAGLVMLLVLGKQELGATGNVLIGFAMLYLLALAHVPIGVAMAITGLTGLYVMLGPLAALTVGTNNLTSSLSSADLAAVPLFLLMGNLAVAAGFADDIFAAATSVFGRMRGGHAVATVIGCAGFGAISGSSVATTATLGDVAFREMEARDYAPSLATGSIAAGGTLGALIPPSVILIIYCVIAELSIADAFMAALLPGVLALALYVVAIMVQVRLWPGLAPDPDPDQKIALLHAFTLAWRPTLLFLTVVGGLYGGVFTVQEAAAAGTGITFVFWLASGRANLPALTNALRVAIGTGAGLYLLIIGANIFGAYLNLAGVANVVVSIINPELLPVWAILVSLAIMYLVLGSVFDTVAALVVTVPFVIPIIAAMDLDLIWWGVITLTLVEIGMITPPIGMNVFVLKSVLGAKASISTIFRGVLPFLAADMVRLTLLMVFPAISLWLGSVL